MNLAEDITIKEMIKGDNIIQACCVCNDITSRGPEDSLYAFAAIGFPYLFSYRTGDTIGPLCTHCYDCLKIIGAITDNYEEVSRGPKFKKIPHEFRKSGNTPPVVHSVGELVNVLKRLPDDLIIDQDYDSGGAQCVVYNYGEDDCHLCFEPPPLP
jgi:hypothetical protein